MAIHLAKTAWAGAFAALALGFSGGVASAAPMLDFQIDYDASSVVLTETGGSGATVSAAIAESGLGPIFSLGAGESQSFDFLRFTPDCTGLRCNGLHEYDITATLVFEIPDQSVSSDGNAGAAVLFGGIIGGALFWDDVPITLTTSDGSMYTVDFEGGIDFFLGRSATTSASVSVDKIVAIAEPATLALFRSRADRSWPGGAATRDRAAIAPSSRLPVT